MKKVVLVEMHMDENVSTQNVLDSIKRFAQAQQDDKVVVTQADHDLIGKISGVRKIHETSMK